MEDNKKVARVLTPAQFAAKWWADRLDGTVNDIRLDKEFMERAELEKIVSPENAPIIDGIMEEFVSEKERQLSVLQLFPAERKKFEEELIKVLEREIETKGIVDLCVDEDGAQLALSWVAERAEIDYGKNSIFTFAPFVEMLVGKEEVVIRFDENDDFETIYNKENTQLSKNEEQKEKSVALHDNVKKEIEKENHR